jgi:hypothetical protein
MITHCLNRSRGTRHRTPPHIFPRARFTHRAATLGPDEEPSRRPGMKMRAGGEA